MHTGLSAAQLRFLQNDFNAGFYQVPQPPSDFSPTVSKEQSAVDNTADR